MRVQIGTALRRQGLLWFLKRNFSYLVQKSRPKISDLLKPPFYKGLDAVSPKLPRLSDGGSFRVRQEFSGLAGFWLLHFNSNLEEVVVYLFASGNRRPVLVVELDFAECPVSTFCRLWFRKFRDIGDYRLAISVKSY